LVSFRVIFLALAASWLIGSCSLLRGRQDPRQQAGDSLPPTDSAAVRAALDSLPQTVAAADSAALLALLDSLPGLAAGTADTSLALWRGDTLRVVAGMVLGRQDTFPISDLPAAELVWADSAGVFAPPRVLDAFGNDLSPLEISPDAVEQPVVYAARDSMIFDLESGKIYLYGAGSVQHKDISLKAGIIEVDLDSNLLHATYATDSLGKPIEKPDYTDAGGSYTADEMSYNFVTKTGLAKGVFTEESSGFLHGEVTKMHPDGSVHLLHGKFTTCELEHPHFYFELTKAKLISQKLLVSGPFYMVLGGVPTPLALPFGLFPVKQAEKLSGFLIPAVNNEQRRGRGLTRGGYYFGGNEHIDLALTADVFSLGSWGLRANSNYAARYRFRGSAEMTYTRTVLGDRSIPGYTTANSYWLNWNHSQDPKARPNSSFSATVSAGSSNHQQLTALDAQNYLSAQFNSSVAYSRSGTFGSTPWNLSSSLRHTQNTQTKIMTMSLPELVFSINRIQPFQRFNQSGERKWYDNFSLRYTASLRNQITAPDSLIFNSPELFNNGFQHNIPLEFTYRWKNFVNFTPRLDYTGVLYTRQFSRAMAPSPTDPEQLALDIDTLDGFVYAHAFNPTFNLALNPTFYGMYQFTRAKRVQAMRHMVIPNLGFSYKPSFGEDPDKYYRYYAVNDSTQARYSIFEGALFGTPLQYAEYGNLSFSLANSLEMKVLDKKDSTGQATKKVRIIEALNMSTGYNLFADSLRLGDLNLNGRTSLFELLNINMVANFSPYAVNELGARVDQFLWEVEQSDAPLRLSSANITAGITFKSKALLAFEKVQDRLRQDPEAARYAQAQIPWDLRLNYSWNYSNTTFNRETQEFEPNINQTLNFSGSFSLTPKWNTSFNSGYDFINKRLTYTTLNITRDLHCWQMSLNMVPFGSRRSYVFQINAKAGILQDLKLDRNRSWFDNF